MPDAITSQLAAMLGQDVQDAESTGDPTTPARVPVHGMSAALPEYGSGQQTGRSGTVDARGQRRLRNFRAMNDGKLTATAYSVAREGNDAEAWDAICEQLEARGLFAEVERRLGRTDRIARLS